MTSKKSIVMWILVIIIIGVVAFLLVDSSLFQGKLMRKEKLITPTANNLQNEGIILQEGGTDQRKLSMNTSKPSNFNASIM